MLNSLLYYLDEIFYSIFASFILNRLWKQIRNNRKQRRIRIKKARKEKIRQQFKCNFDNVITQEKFNEFIENSKHNIDRLKSLTSDGHLVNGVIFSISGLSEWKFTIDFNDFGHITGNYWLYSDNTDSVIPYTIANRIKEDIVNCLKINQDNEKASSHIHKSKRFYIELFSILFLTVFIVGYICLNNYNQSKLIYVGINSNELRDLNYQELVDQLSKNGFTNISVTPVYDLLDNEKEKDNTVNSMQIDGRSVFLDSSKVSYDAVIEITYHTFKYSILPVGNEEIMNMDYHELTNILIKAGFVNVKCEPKYDLIIGLFSKEDMVDSMTIDGSVKYEQGSSISRDANIIVVYHSFWMDKE